MKRRRLALLILAGFLTLPAGRVEAADEQQFDCWRFADPEGWTRRSSLGFVAFAWGKGDQVTQLGLYKSRAAAPVSLDEEAAQEWRDVVEANFAAGTPTRGKDRRLACGAVARVRTAPTTDKAGGSSHTALYVLAPYGRIASILVNAKSAERLAEEDGVVSRFLDGLRLDVDAVVRANGAEPGGTGKPADLVGAWAWSQSATTGDGIVHLGSSKQQYRFAADGTYAFQREAWGGSYRANEWFVVTESGTYEAKGDRLTITPKRTDGVVKDAAGTALKSPALPRETVTYLWRLVLFEGLGETQLALTPPGETERDGLFASNEAWKTSYLLSATYRPEWRVFPK